MRDVPPFVFHGCVQVFELLGVEAHDARELLEGLRQATDDSIFCHTYGFLLRQPIGSAPYPNDFAVWVGTTLGDRGLAERLAIVDPFVAGSVGEVRAELVAAVEDHVRHPPRIPLRPAGQPFAFLRLFNEPVPTNLRATTLAELRDGLAEVDASVLFFHVVESRFRLGRARGDLSEWIASALGQPELAERLDRIDPYVGTLERVRERYLTVLGEALEPRG